MKIYWKHLGGEFISFSETFDIISTKIKRYFDLILVLLFPQNASPASLQKSKDKLGLISFVSFNQGCEVSSKNGRLRLKAE